MQSFSIPTDTFSASNDLILNYQAVPTPYTSTTSYLRSPVFPANKGVNICGSRSYTIDPACSAFLLVNTAFTGTGDGYTYLELSPTLASQVTVTAGLFCSVKAYLTNYPTKSVTQSVNVRITACALSFIYRTSALPAMTEYYLMDTAQQISFPTYT